MRTRAFWMTNGTGFSEYVLFKGNDSIRIILDDTEEIIRINYICDLTGQHWWHSIKGFMLWLERDPVQTKEIDPKLVTDILEGKL